MQLTKVTCPKCASIVIPRLWHYGGSIVFHISTQHICPICGSVMYESPGTVRSLVRFGTPLLFTFFAFIFLSKGIYQGFIISLGIAVIFIILGFPAASGKAVRKLIGRVK